MTTRARHSARTTHAPHTIVQSGSRVLFQPAEAFQIDDDNMNLSLQEFKSVTPWGDIAAHIRLVMQGFNTTLYYYCFVFCQLYFDNLLSSMLILFLT